MEGFPLLHAILFAEFHPVQGPKVVFDPKQTAAQEPPSQQLRHQLSSFDSLDPVLDFDSISEYIIPKTDLCNRLVTLSTPFYKIVGHPVLIENPKYERNALLFNLCFVFDKDANTTCYEQVATKIARVLRSLEVESDFLHNPATKSTLLSIIEQLLEDLNAYNECQIPINDANVINLKLFPQYPTPPSVYDYQVPVCMLDLESIMDKYWDLTMRRTIPCINGVNSIRRIGELADVNTELVRHAVQHLLHYGCVRMVDIFQFSNIYNVTCNLSALLATQHAQLDCVDFVRKPTANPSFGAVFQLYCALKGGMKLSDWIQENSLGVAMIDIRRFIVYGLLKGYIYRIHRYPILLQPLEDTKQIPDRMIAHIAPQLNGLHHFDDLCTQLKCSAKDLEDRLANSGLQYHILHK
eukprot:jgi/Hompol1/5200/HPOL_004228-RA